MARASFRALGALVVGLASCGRIDYDPLSESAGDSDGGPGQPDASTTVPAMCQNGSDSNCPAQNLGIGINNQTTVGSTTVDDQDAFQGSCGGAGTGELRIQFNAIGAFTAQFEVVATFDTVLYVLDGGCGGPEIACSNIAGNGGEEYEHVFQDGESIVLIADGVDACGDIDIEILTF